MKYKIQKLKPKNQKDLFISGVNIAFENEIILNNKKVIKALLKREDEFSTNFGQGFAIPHCQSEYVKEPFLLFTSFDSEIKYGKEKPIIFAVFIFLPKALAGNQIKILSMLTRKLIYPEYQNKIKNLDEKEISKIVKKII